MTQVQVAVSLTAFGFTPRPGTAVKRWFEVRRLAEGHGPACHGTFEMAVPENAR